MAFFWIVATLFFNSAAGSILMRIEGVPFVAALCIAIASVLTGTMFTWVVGARLAVSLLRIIKGYFDRVAWDDAAGDFLRIRGPLRRILAKRKEVRGRLIGFIAKQTTVIIFLILCAPFVPSLPELGTIALKATKNPEMRKVIVLLSAAAIRTASVVTVVYLWP